MLGEPDALNAPDFSTLEGVKELELTLGAAPRLLKGTLTEAQIAELNEKCTPTVLWLSAAIKGERKVHVASASLIVGRVQSALPHQPLDVCTFCLGELSKGEQNEHGRCQRCGEGDLFAVFVKGKNWSITRECRDGGDEGDDALPFLKVCFDRSTLPQLPASKEVAELLRRAHAFIIERDALRRREELNTQWLLDLISNELLKLCASPRCKWFRLLQRGKPEAVLGESPSIGEVFEAWMCTKAPRRVLQEATSNFAPVPFLLTAKKRATKVSRDEGVFATHLLFMATDWLLAAHLPVDAKVLEYVKRAHDVLKPHRKHEVELYIELVACEAVLMQDHEMMREAAAFVRALDWGKVMQYEIRESRSTRYAADVELHMLILRAWILALADKMADNRI